ncbi:MAG: inclusion body family protein [Acidobacteriota bacterium]
MAKIDANALSDSGTSAVIYVTIVIDADTVITTYPNPSKDPNSPTGISHGMGFMTTSSEYVVSGNGTGDLSIKAEVGDVIRWTSLSESGNMDAAVFTYAFDKFGGTQVTGPVTLEPFTKMTIFPTTANPPAVKQVNQNFWFMVCDVTNVGTENYNVKFGLYTRTRGTDGQSLLGYFYWDPTLQVNR